MRLQRRRGRIKEVNEPVGYSQPESLGQSNASPRRTYRQGRGTVSVGFFFSNCCRQTGQFLRHIFTPVYSLANGPVNKIRFACSFFLFWFLDFTSSYVFVSPCSQVRILWSQPSTPQYQQTPGSASISRRYIHWWCLGHFRVFTPGSSTGFAWPGIPMSM
jgi:hypothetical protein